MSANIERLRSLFARPELQRLVNRLRERRELGRAFSGTITLPNALADERRAVDQLLRRTTTSGLNLGIPLDSLLQQLRRAQLADSWSEFLDVVCGPPDPDRAIAAEKSRSWESLWSRAASLPSNNRAKSQEWLEWLERLRRTGLLKRLSCDNPSQAEEWLIQAGAVLSQLPLDNELLASLAARLMGNSHALDLGSPLATIVLRGIAVFLGCSMPTCGAERRGLWSKAGVICDELSAPVLVFNLPIGKVPPVTRLLAVAAEAIMPLHLTTKLLQGADWKSAVVPPRVYVCENPSLIALATQQVGASSAPLVCVDGEPKTAGWLLLEHLRDAGAKLWYHGDFDWKGVAIAGRIIERVGATPWRYGAEDYLASPGGDFLEGSPVATPWCPRLSEALCQRQVLIHEEAIAHVLLEDLRAPCSTRERSMRATFV